MKKMVLITLFSITMVAVYGTSKEFKKEIAKEFSVSATPTLNIENKYGNIRIIEGTENKIMFKVEIIGKGNNQELAKKYAESVTIKFSQNGDEVSAETVLQSINCNNCGRTINYVVVTPKNTTMDLENKYGNVFLDNVVKPLELDLKYGDFEVNSLSKAAIDIEYGKGTVGSCEELILDSKYSKFKFKNIGKLITDSKYDGFEIGTVGDFLLETAYTNIKIEKLRNSFITDNFKYCSLDIAEVATDFNKIVVEAAYTNVKLGLNEGHNFNADLTAKYGEIKLGKIQLPISKSRFQKEANGSVGNSTSKASVVISVSYGNIEFK